MSVSAAQTRPPVVLEIGGQRLRLSANTDQSHLERLAHEVNERIATMGRETRSNQPGTLLALVALQLADELDEARRSLEQVREESRRAVAAAETRAREVEALARKSVIEALAEIDRALAQDDEGLQRGGRAESESA
ncbi:MAG: cell division protein ZapA [Deltaproteobacteria bacterium]